MRQNFSGNKRRKEELRKKKQEAKRNKRLNKHAQIQQPETLVSGQPLENPVLFPAQEP